MGIGVRRPFVPTATDSAIESAEDIPAENDLATDLSKVTDRSFQTLPENGDPITVPTSLKPTTLGRLVQGASQSQTSLLIEYFEAGTGPERKPSVRVKVTPSSRTSKDKEGHIIVTESQGVRQPPQSHHIALGANNLTDSMSAVDSELPIRRSRAPVEIEVYQGSELSVPSELPDPRYRVADSDISSMPADSMLGISQPAIMTQPAPSDSINRSEISEISEISEKENLKPPVLPIGLNKSNERLVRNVAEKIAKSRAHPSKSALSEQSRSRSSVGRDVDFVEPRRRTTKNIEDDSITGTASSQVTGSVLSAEPRANDARSVRSGQSNVSVTNPKLLQTVEDAIRRLILPELKEIKKDQRHGSSSKRYKEISPSDSFESSSVSREETTRQKSSSGKTKRRSSKEHGHRVSSGSKKHHKTVDYDSQSEQSYRDSVENASVDRDRKSRKHKGHRARDLAAGAIAGGALTAAALKHHESGSSLDHRERRKKRSKSRSSRSASVAESEEIFNKHDVPPMPMRSDLGSEMTRSSILSSNTNGTMTPTRREVREVVRGSPGELLSPVSQTSSKTPTEKQSPNKSVDMQRGLGTHHGNYSEQDLAAHRDENDENVNEASPDFARDGFGAIISQGLMTDPERARAYERNLHHQHPIRRGLSPIQSVASYATTEPNRTSVIHPRSSESLSSQRKERELKDQISIASMSSAPSTDLAKSRRPQGLSFENRSEIMQPHKHGRAEATRDLDTDDFYQDQHSRNDEYRDSYASEDPYLDKATAGQQLSHAYRANPEYIDSPHEVESAVASLYEPSSIGSGGNLSPVRSYHSQSYEQVNNGSPRSLEREVDMQTRGSPLKQQMAYPSHDNLSREAALSPVQSVSATPPIAMDAPQTSKGVDAAAAVPSEGQDAQSPESEITTNPSVIQGPIAPYDHGNRDHWPYDPTPPPLKDDMIPGPTRDLGLGPADLVPEALSISHAPTHEGKRTIHITAPIHTPPGMIDEGYDTGAHAPSPVPLPGDRAIPMPASIPAAVPFSTSMGIDDLDNEDDPFTTGKKNQYISGLSQGMSPLYDGATGRGIDRIQSKDIVALMDHLTVRDAQRNARDTEILVTLVRTAAEMRNSFEDMKKLMNEQGDMLLDTSEKQHERTQKAIGGPRPQPPSASARFARTPAQSEDDSDLPAKRRNIFKRAVRGLGAKNAQELQNIEGMLMQLLDDVEGLRTLHTGGPISNENRTASLTSDNNHVPTDPGYEPEGQAGTSSTGDRSGIFSGNSSRQANYQTFGRQESANRVSTVLEGDEEYENQVEQTTPKASYVRGASETYQTPPRTATTNKGTLSNEHTPHYSTESSGRKHKSFASAFLPKMVSRWSKTTASSTGEYRNTLTKQRPYSQVSQSGSNVGEYDYDHTGDDRLRSNTCLQNEHYQQENRPPSPLLPSQVSGTDTNPKYQAHRNSLNLQHPQPRQGPTGRFQHHLESEAQMYKDPISPTSVTSSQWEAQAGVSAMSGAGPNGGLSYTHGGHLSPISDGGYSETSAAMAERDRAGGQRVGSASRDQEPLFPPRTAKMANSYADHVAAARAGSPALDKSPVSALRTGNSPAGVRKPSGPRPLSGSGQYASQSRGPQGDMGMVKKTRFRGSPYHIESDDGIGS